MRSGDLNGAVLRSVVVAGRVWKLSVAGADW
jgi:hypothetical protein